MSGLADELRALATLEHGAPYMWADCLRRAATALEVYEKALRDIIRNEAGGSIESITSMIARDALASAASGGEIEK